MPCSYLRFAAGGLLAGAVACGPISSARLHGRTPTGEPAPRPGTVPGDLGGPLADPAPRTPDVGDLPGPATGTRYPGGERLVCRTSGVPHGWIAIAYVSSAGQCPARRGADSTATAAVLTHYADDPVGMELDVCADERIPRGWVRAREEAADAGRCPGAVRGDGPTTKRIRRLR